MSSAHDVADARLHRICAALVGRGLAVRLRGVGERSAGPAGVEVETVARGAWPQRLGRALGVIGAGDPAALVVVDPELAVTGLVWRARRRRPLVVDVHEDYLQVPDGRAWVRPWLRSVVRVGARFAVGAAARADLTAVADEHVPPVAARRRLVVRNLPRRGEIPDAGEPQPPPRALYVGTVNRERGLETMAETVLAAPGWRLELVGPVAADDLRWVRRRFAAVGRADDLVIAGRLPPDRAWRRVRGAWVGLAQLTDLPAYRAAMPSKVYEYAAAGLPTVATDLPRLRRFLEGEGCGVVTADAAEAAAALRRFADDPTSMRPYREAARRWAARELGDGSPFDELARAVSELVDAPAGRGRQ